VPREKAKVGTVRGVHISAEELSALFNVSRDTVARYVRDDQMPKSSWGKYPVWDCVQWFINRAAGQGTGAGQLEDARKRLLEEQIRRAHMDNEKERGQLLDLESVRVAVSAAMADIATQMRGLAARNAARLAALDDPQTIQRVLTDEIRHVLDSASRQVAAFALVLASGADPDAPTKPKRRGVGRRAPDSAAGLTGAGALAD